MPASITHKRRARGAGRKGRLRRLAPLIERLVGNQIASQVSQSVRQIQRNRNLVRRAVQRPRGPQRRRPARGRGVTILRASGKGRLFRKRRRITPRRTGQGLRRAGEGLNPAGGRGRLSAQQKNILRALL